MPHRHLSAASPTESAQSDSSKTTHRNDDDVHGISHSAYFGGSKAGHVYGNGPSDTGSVHVSSGMRNEVNVGGNSGGGLALEHNGGSSTTKYVYSRSAAEWKWSGNGKAGSQNDWDEDDVSTIRGYVASNASTVHAQPHVGPQAGSNVDSAVTTGQLPGVVHASSRGLGYEQDNAQSRHTSDFSGGVCTCEPWQGFRQCDVHGWGIPNADQLSGSYAGSFAFDSHPAFRVHGTTEASEANSVRSTNVISPAMIPAPQAFFGTDKVLSWLTTLASSMAPENDARSMAAENEDLASVSVLVHDETESRDMSGGTHLANGSQSRRATPAPPESATEKRIFIAPGPSINDSRASELASIEYGSESGYVASVETVGGPREESSLQKRRTRVTWSKQRASATKMLAAPTASPRKGRKKSQKKSTAERAVSMVKR
ncbi:uncharacterized protein LAESUDRAFT_756013 [Laetiporus sulphureus 93-53]|uniref:Uncharacterized protein n=1 Tax=Laetiporus sulphureus 93-53 TaxID=1314785 RepID=A0A165GLW1_9APHY|nr:uncharacterized protein LAESUDRAFT_756013 [Laetiporus sulphureus 93-53]KZT10530.1 hypothetical protein LAESUDRAFT_756013 [Laetiporus sulphureus 93-53]